MQAVTTEVNIDQRAESRAEEFQRTGLDVSREVVGKILARMSQDVYRLTSQRESPGICNDGYSANEVLNERHTTSANFDVAGCSKMSVEGEGVEPFVDQSNRE